MEVKGEVAEIKKMVTELYDRLFIPTSVVMEIEPKIEAKNI